MILHVRLVSLMLAASATAAFATRAADDPVEGDLKTIQGEWTVPSASGGEVSYTFKGSSLAIEAPSRSYKMTIKLDPKAKPEKAIDFHIDDGPDDAKGKDSVGIYKIEADGNLTICFRAEGDRPTKFEQIGFEQFVTKLKAQEGRQPEVGREETSRPAARGRAQGGRRRRSPAQGLAAGHGSSENRGQAIPGLSQRDCPRQESKRAKQPGDVLLALQSHPAQGHRDDGTGRDDLPNRDRRARRQTG